MKVFLTHPPDMEIQDTLLELEPTLSLRPYGKLAVPVGCGNCGGIHHFIFKKTGRQRLHDDGTFPVFAFVGIEN